MKISEVKPGDRVTRTIGPDKDPWMEMEVVSVDDKLITCKAVVKDKETGEEQGFFNGGWTFDRATGAEEDEDLKWGVKYGATGSFIEPKD